MIRYRKNGYNVYACSNDLDEAKRLFIERLCQADALKRQEASNLFYVPMQLYGQPVQQMMPQAQQYIQPVINQTVINGIPTSFGNFSDYYFENFYKRKVCKETYRITLSNYKNHVLPHFGNVPVTSITPHKCQILLDKLIDEDKARTAENVTTMLNTLFTAALKHGIIQHNPMDMVFHTKHDREHGKALSKEEENKLLTQTAGTPYQRMFAVGLYTGMRPNEYKTAKIEGNFIVANNSKRKNGKVELKKIPITPMLRHYLEGVTQLSFVRCEALRLKMKEILPDHKLYDLRTTFYTRCMECGIAEPAIKKYVGHTLGGLADTYTDLSDEFLLKEGEKFKY
jgi:integrase